MFKLKILDKFFNKKSLLTNKNFINNQNYILGKSEKKKVLASFLSTKILGKITSSIILRVFSLIVLSIFLITLNHFVWLFFSVIFFIMWLFSYHKRKVNKISDYFLLKEENFLNSYLSFWSIIVGIIFIPLFIIEKNIILIDLVTMVFKGIFISIIVLLVIFEFILNWKISVYIQKVVNFIARIDVLNLLLLPLLSIFGILLYLLMYIYNWLKKYQIIKNNPTKSSKLDFIEKNWVFENWIYKIIRK